MTRESMEQTRLLWNARSEDDKHWYVYLYVDPFDKRVFYVGMGERNRVFDHLDQKSEAKKVEKIMEIRNRGKEPDIDILWDGLDKRTAEDIEAAVIDAIGLDNLTNVQSGHKHQRCPISRSPRIREKAIIKHNVLVIIINRLFPQFFHEGEYDPYDPEHVDRLFSLTRMMWKIDHNRFKSIDYILPSYQGTIQDVFEVDRTRYEGIIKVREAYKQGMFTHERDGKYYFESDRQRPLDEKDIDGTLSRSILFGKKADEEVRKLYKNRYLKTESKGNPIKYFFTD